MEYWANEKKLINIDCDDELGKENAEERRRNHVREPMSKSLDSMVSNWRVRSCTGDG